MFTKIAKFFLYVSVFCVAIVSTTTLFPFIVGKYVWFRTSVDLALIAFLLALVFDPKENEHEKRLKQLFTSPLGISVSLFALAFLLASLLGWDPVNSFWSNFERGEGGLQILHLYTFFVLLVTLFRSMRDWIKLFVCSLGAAFLMIVYGFFAATESSNFLASAVFGFLGIFSTFGNFIGESFKDPGFRFDGSIGNSAYVGGYLIFSFFYLLYVLQSVFAHKTEERQRTLKIGALIFLLALFIVVFGLTGTRGALIGLILGLVTALAYFGYSRRAWRKWLMIGGVFFLLLVGALIYFQNTPFVQHIPGSRIFTISTQADTFVTRRIIWANAWHGFLARPVFGWGPENFLHVFDAYFNTAYFVPTQSFGAWFDRAHSIVFDYLAETGVVGFAAFIGMFVVFYLEFFRKSRKSAAGKETSLVPFHGMPVFLRGALFAIPIAYLVQGVILFDVLVIYLNLFLFFGFAAYLFLPETSHHSQ